MEHPFNELRSLRNSAHLTPAERMSILSHINAGSTQSPYSGLILITRRATSFALLILLTGGIGFSAAADNSLPGSSLYPIKTNFTEPIQEAVHVTPQSQINWKITQTERRFNEATQLAESGKLTPEIETMLVTRIQEHVQEATSIAEDNFSEDVSKKLEVSATIKSTIETQVAELEAIPEQPSDTTTQTTTPEPPTTILATAQTLIDQITDQQETHLAEVAETNPEQAENLAQALYETEFKLATQQARTALETAHTTLATYTLVFPAPATVPVTTPVNTTADTNIVDGVTPPDATTKSVSTPNALEVAQTTLAEYESAINKLIATETIHADTIESLKKYIGLVNEYIITTQKAIDEIVTASADTPTPAEPEVINDQPISDPLPLPETDTGADSASTTPKDGPKEDPFKGGQ